MEVVAFVGPSGTGKSHRAIGVAHNNNCDAIIAVSYTHLTLPTKA